MEPLIILIEFSVLSLKNINQRYYILNVISIYTYEDNTCGKTSMRGTKYSNLVWFWFESIEVVFNFLILE